MDQMIQLRTMTLLFVLLWLHHLFTATGDARPIDLAEIIVYNSAASAPPPQFVYAADNTTMFVNFFAASENRLPVAGTHVRVSQRTDYPKSGDIELRIEPEQRATFTLAVRMPAWTRGHVSWSDRYTFELPDVPAATLVVNGQAVRMTFDRGFAKVTREWRSGDVVHVYFPMPEHTVIPANARCTITQRGPVISCRG